MYMADLRILFLEFAILFEQVKIYFLDKNDRTCLMYDFITNYYQ